MFLKCSEHKKGNKDCSSNFLPKDWDFLGGSQNSATEPKDLIVPWTWKKIKTKICFSLKFEIFCYSLFVSLWQLLIFCVITDESDNSPSAEVVKGWLTFGHNCQVNAPAFF